MNRIEAIESRLHAAFPEARIQVRDDSAEHIGHVGHGGAGHFTVTVITPAFRAMPMVARHRAVNRAVADLMGPEIHALAIEAYAPD